MKKILTFFLSISLLASSTAKVLPCDTYYAVCFTPGRRCSLLLAKFILQAKQSVYVQAYTFTSYILTWALIKAEKRGVKVYVILDKSNFKNNADSKFNEFKEAGIPVWDDSKLNIAHNKVMIIDNEIVETGSFNFTTSAEKYNAENMLIIKNADLANLYLDNWKRRQSASEQISP